METYSFYTQFFLALLLSVCFIFMNYYRGLYLEEKRERKYLLDRFKEYVKQHKNAKE